MPLSSGMGRRVVDRYLCSMYWTSQTLTTVGCVPGAPDLQFLLAHHALSRHDANHGVGTHIAACSETREMRLIKWSDYDDG